jgi:hypothetical protein
VHAVIKNDVGTAVAGSEHRVSEIIAVVVKDVIRAKIAKFVVIPRAGGRDHLRARSRSNLDGCVADTAGTTVDQTAIAEPEVSVIDQGTPGGDSSDAGRTGSDGIDTIR